MNMFCPHNRTKSRARRIYGENDGKQVTHYYACTTPGTAVLAPADIFLMLRGFAMPIVFFTWNALLYNFVIEKAGCIPFAKSPVFLR